MTYEEHFNGDCHQLTKLPAQWMDASRFKVGQKVRLTKQVHYDWAKAMPEVICEVVKVTNGYGSWPVRILQHEGEPFEDNQHPGWLTIRLPGPVGTTWKNGKGVPEFNRAATLPDEGIEWELVKI